MLSVESVSKRFGAVRALSSVSAEFRAGEIHALLGENGAGKSTLVSIICGFISSDSGRVLLQREPLPKGNPLAARQRGIELVHQHFMLVPEFTVAENLALARMAPLATRSNPRQEAAAALAKAKELGWEVPLDDRTGNLPVGVQQRIEILKALAADARVLILDEPTAVLDEREIADLFIVLRSLCDQGVCIVLIAHKLREVLAIADRVTVLRHGELVASAPRADVDERRLAEWMVGDLPEPPRPAEAPSSAVALEVQGLRVVGDKGAAVVRDASLSVRKGEILGIGGVDGNGQVELAEAIAGIRPFAAGRITLEPRGASVAYIPQDRRRDALALRLTVFENLLIGGLRNRALFSGPFLKASSARRWSANLVQDYAIKVGQISDPVGSLSGGNQQKVVVARTMSGNPDVIVAVNPTRGLDVAATKYVHEILIEVVRKGAGLLLISTDRDELQALSSRVLYISRGQIVDTFIGALE